MKAMRRISKLGMAVGLLALFFLFYSSWSTTVASASDRATRIRTIEPAELHKRSGHTLVFVADKRGRIVIIRGELSDRTQIFDENGEDINTDALELGSTWQLKIKYPSREGGLPVILVMKRIRSKAPE